MLTALRKHMGMHQKSRQISLHDDRRWTHSVIMNFTDQCLHAGNQYFNLTIQLDAGVRLIQAQGHRDPNGTEQVRLCHFNCALMDGGSLEEYLKITKTWLEENPQEVVTFLFVNSGVPLMRWAEAFVATGFDAISYTPPPEKRYGHMGVEDWPTIEEMVNSGKRAVTFLSRGAWENAVPWILPEFSYVFEVRTPAHSLVALLLTPNRATLAMKYQPTSPVMQRVPDLQASPTGYRSSIISFTASSSAFDSLMSTR